jgi:hypothetical protein
MYGIFLSALNTAFGFFVRNGLIKFAILFAVYFVIAEFANTLSSLINGTSACCSASFNASGIASALAQIPSSIWYFLDLFSFTQGLCLVLTAHIYRFLIRRLPVIG